MGFISGLKFIRLFSNLIGSRSLIDRHRHISGIGRVVTSWKIMLSSFLFISMHVRINYLSTPDVDLILPRVKYYALD